MDVEAAAADAGCVLSTPMLPLPTKGVGEGRKVSCQ